MQWIIEGADIHSGEEQRCTVEADSRAAAEQAVRERGILISSVQQVASPADALEAMYGGPAPLPADLKAFVEAPARGPLRPAQRPPAPPPPSPLANQQVAISDIHHDAGAVDYAAPHGDGVTPRYTGLKVAGVVLGVLCGAGYLLGLVMIIPAAHAYLTRSSPSTAAALLIAASPLAAAGVLHALSVGCLALRDIAQSSFSASRRNDH